MSSKHRTPPSPPARKPRLGPKQWLILEMVNRFTDAPGEAVHRNAIGATCHALGTLDVAESAVEPTVSRALRRLFEMSFIDVDIGQRHPSMWLAESIRFAAEHTWAEYLRHAGRELEGAPMPEMYIGGFERDYEGLRAAHASGRWRAAAAAYGNPTLARIRTIRITDAGQEALAVHLHMAF